MVAKWCVGLVVSDRYALTEELLSTSAADHLDDSRPVCIALFPDAQGHSNLCSCRGMIDTDGTVVARSASWVGGCFVDYDAEKHHTTETSAMKVMSDRASRSERRAAYV